MIRSEFSGCVVAGALLLVLVAAGCSDDTSEVDALRARVDELEAQASATQLATSSPPAARPTMVTSAATPTNESRATDAMATLNRCVLGWSMVALNETKAGSVRLTSTALAGRYAEEAAETLAELDGAGCRGVGVRAAGEPQAEAECGWVLDQLATWEAMQQVTRLAGSESQAAARALEELWAFDAAAC